MKTTRNILAVVTMIAAMGLLAGTAEAGLVGQLGILDLTANGGLNPATGNPWQLGDQYRLGFVTSTTTQATSTDIDTYNTFVQNVANAASLNLGGATWKVLGSTSTVDARDNTHTNPGVDGTGVAVFLMDGSTVFANNNADLWNGTSLRTTGVYWSLCFDENGVEPTADISAFVGTNVNGTKRDRALGGSTETPPKVETGKIRPNNSSRWLVQYNANTTSYLPLYALSDPLTVQSAGGIAVGETFGNWGLEWSNDPTEQLNLVKTATDLQPFDKEITVTGGLESIIIDETVLNASGTAWTDYHLILGRGLGGQFEAADGLDGLAFLSASSTAFDGAIQVSPGEFLFHGGILAPGEEASFRLELTMPQGDPVTFTLRQAPSVPEPASAVLVMLAVPAVLARVRRRVRAH